MQVIDAGFGGIFAEIMHQVPDVVQQAGRDQGVGAAGFLGKPRGLQRVLALVDGA